MNNRTFVAIDLKSFYASVECVERGLDPLDANLVVADAERTEKTICLAVSSALKTFGVGSRPRLFEVVERVRQVNNIRKRNTPGKMFSGKSVSLSELNNNRFLEVGYIVAPPRMALYIRYSTEIYNIYLRYFSPDDIHVYSIDEVFIDVTNYLELYKTTAHQLTIKIIREVLSETGITATAGIGTNLYLCKIAMDIVAKHIPADKDGVRIAELDEESYKEQLWAHTPITDFWRTGAGTAKRLEKLGIYTMGDIARHSLDRRLIGRIYAALGKNAELLIDHAWGIEPVTIADIKAYKPSSNSVSTGQVLSRPYSYGEARLIVKEMADNLSLDLAEKNLVTSKITLTIGYDCESLNVCPYYSGEVTTDHYGRIIPKHAHGTENLARQTFSSRKIRELAVSLFERIVNPNLLVRRINICACEVAKKDGNADDYIGEQLDLFTDYEKREQNAARERREKDIQLAVLKIKRKFGKNAILKGMNFEPSATTQDRNRQIGGHKA